MGGLKSSIIDTAKQVGSGQWSHVFSHFAPGVEFNQRNSPCPKCGGTDRYFAYPDFETTGGVHCRHCKHDGADGVSTVAWWLGVTDEQAAARIVEAFGGGQSSSLPRVQNVVQPASTTTDRGENGYAPIKRSEANRFEPVNSKILSAFADGAGFTVEACKQLDVMRAVIPARYFSEEPNENGRNHPEQTGIAFPCYGRNNLEISNWLLRPDRLTKKLVLGHKVKDLRKSSICYTVDKTQHRNDRDGILLTRAGRDLIRTGQRISGLRVLKVEGELDLLAAVSSLPPDEYLVFTNTFGASFVCDWAIELISKLGPVEWIIAPDNDDAGREGANRWRDGIVKHTPSAMVKVLKLPVDEGQDFRDWVKAGGTVDQFEKLLGDASGEGASKEKEPGEKASGEDEPNVTLTETEQTALGMGLVYSSYDDQSPSTSGTIRPTMGAVTTSAAPGTPPVQSQIRDFGDMAIEFTDLRPVLVEGMLRLTEVANVIASPKVGKSYLVGSLALSIATGRPWLGMDVKQGPVLLIDNEIHIELITDRLCRIAKGMEIPETEIDGQLKVMSLRGRGCDIHELATHFGGIQRGEYSLVILDALYRFIPAGTSENDNAEMTQIYNAIDSYAELLGSSFVCVHHSSKGLQSEKGVTDMGAGAGAISRAADTHIAIRPHEQEGLAVLEAVTRSFKQPPPISLKWDYPLWYATTTPPALRKKDNGQAQRDHDTDQQVLEVLKTRAAEWLSVTQIRNALGCGQERAARSLIRLKGSDKITTQVEERKGESVTVYQHKSE
jgi:hypothetical protein